MSFREDRREVRRAVRGYGHRGHRRGSELREDREDYIDKGEDLEGLSPRGQAVAGAITGGAVLLGVLLVLALNPGSFWLIFVFAWLLFPALRTFSRGVARLADSAVSSAPKPTAGDRERELLEALRGGGEISPAQAAIQTSLTVSEADEMLGNLAKGGHLRVRVSGGGIFYSLWEAEPGDSREREAIRG